MLLPYTYPVTGWTFVGGWCRLLSYLVKAGVVRGRVTVGFLSSARTLNPPAYKSWWRIETQQCISSTPGMILLLIMMRMGI